MPINIFSRNKNKLFQDIQPENAKKQMESDTNTILLDVRTPEEHYQRHIPGSKLIPLADLYSIKQQVPDLNTPIIVYCQSGSRSTRAAEQLTQMGYVSVFNLGGISRWPYSTQTGK